MTTSIYSLCAKRGYLVVSQLKHFTPKTSSQRDFQNVVYNFLTFTFYGDIRKFVQIPVNLTSAKLFKCLISPSILKIKRIDQISESSIKRSIFFNVYFRSFINYWKPWTICKSSLNFNLLGHPVGAYLRIQDALCRESIVYLNIESKGGSQHTKKT